MNKPLRDLELLQTLEGVPALNVLHLGAAVPDGDTVSIGGRVYECDDSTTGSVTAGRVRVPAAMGHANATLNFDDSQNVADGNTVSVGGKVYTFKAVLTNVDGYVKSGPTIERSIYNLVAALNVGNVGLYEPPANYGDKNDAGEGAGVAYAAATAKNPADIEAGYGGDYDLTVAHRPGGVAGNGIALAETLVGNGAWVEGNTVDQVPNPSADVFGGALAAAINSDPLGLVFAEKVSAAEVVVWSRRPGDVRLACAAAFTNGANVWEWAALAGGMVAREALMPVAAVSRVASAQEAARGRMYFVFGFEPAGALLQVRTGAGAPVAFDGAVVVTGRRVTVTSGTVAVAAGQVFNLMVFN